LTVPAAPGPVPDRLVIELTSGNPAAFAGVPGWSELAHDHGFL